MKIFEVQQKEQFRLCKKDGSKMVVTFDHRHIAHLHGLGHMKHISYPVGFDRLSYLAMNCRI